MCVYVCAGACWWGGVGGAYMSYDVRDEKGKEVAAGEAG